MVCLLSKLFQAMKFVTQMNTMGYVTLHYKKFNMIVSSKFRRSQDNVKGSIHAIKKSIV